MWIHVHLYLPYLHIHTHIHMHPINKYSRCIAIHKWQLSYQIHWSLDLIQMMVPWAAQTLVKPWMQSTCCVVLALFLCVCFFQLIKHSLKSRSCKDLACMFRKEKGSLTSRWVSGTHSGLPWSLHTVFQNLPILHDQWWRIRKTKLAIFIQREPGRGILWTWLSTAPKSFPFTKMLNDTPSVAHR